MCVLGYNNFCSACAGSRMEDERMVCADANGRFFGLPADCVLMAPCFKPKIRRTVDVQQE